MAFSAQSGLVYIPVSEGTNILFDAAQTHDRRVGLTNSETSSIALGAFKMPSAADLPPAIRTALNEPELTASVPSKQIRAYLDAWDPVRQERVWRHEEPNLFDRSGVLATAGGLVVQGDIEGKLNFYEASTGKLLRSIDTGTSIVAAPMSYSVDGEQYIAVMAGLGGGPLAFAPPPGSAADQRGNEGRVIAFKLGGSDLPMPPLLPPPPLIPQPPAGTASPEAIQHGARLFAQNCARCHLNATTRGASPDLRRMNPATHEIFRQIVLQGLLRPAGMPRWDDVLSEQDADAIHAYLISISVEAYNAQQGGDKHQP